LPELARKYWVTVFAIEFESSTQRDLRPIRMPAAPYSKQQKAYQRKSPLFSPLHPATVAAGILRWKSVLDFRLFSREVSFLP